MKNKDFNKEVKDQSQVKKKYLSPRILPLGDIRDVTMGGSPGVADSAFGEPTKPF